jgi:hypothetical protein
MESILFVACIESQSSSERPSITQPQALKTGGAKAVKKARLRAVD